MFGTVTKYFNDKGYGFIRGEDGRSYFVHNSKLQGEHIERGYYVFFRPFTSDRSTTDNNYLARTLSFQVVDTNGIVNTVNGKTMINNFQLRR